MAAETVRDPMPRFPHLPERVEVTPRSTDAQQGIARTEHGELRITGISAPECVDPCGAEVSLSFDGQTISVGLHAGQSPEKTALMLARVMPSGYRLAVASNRGDELTFELVREPRGEAAGANASVGAQAQSPSAPRRTATPLSTAIPRVSVTR